MFTVFIKEMRQLRRDPVVWSAVGAQLAFGLIALVRLFYLPASELKSATETFIGFVTICGSAAAPPRITATPIGTPIATIRSALSFKTII